MVVFLKNWIEGIAIAVIVVSIFEMLIPNGNLKKYIKIVLGIYVVFTIISPFVDSNALYNFNLVEEFENYTNSSNDSSNVVSTETYSKDLEKIYLDTLENQIITSVESQGYIIKSCDVDAIFETESKDAGIRKVDLVVLKNSRK